MFAKLAAVTLFIVVTITGVQEIKAVMCTYERSIDNLYTCNLINQTILTDSDMEIENGTHLPGLSNDDVTTLVAVGPSSVVEIFPSTLINKFINLKNVYLIDVGMRGFTNSIDFCQALSVVIIILNDIALVPKNVFQNCNQITDLQLSANRISLIDAKAFSGMTQIKRLRLGDNQISYLYPSTFESTRNLKLLDLSRNSIREVSPQTFEPLPLLTNLFLNNNKITTWNSTFHAHNQELQVLLLDKNEISTIGDVFSNLPGLKILRVGNFIDELPTFVGLNSLEELVLSGNILKEVSAESFTNLLSLRNLDLSYNNIETVNFTVLLPSLEILNLAYNNISKISNETFTMPSNLTSINLRRNKIEILTADSIQPITQIQLLDVSFNQIKRIERDFFEGVTYLTFVSLENVCFDNEVTISNRNDFENRVAGLLEPCFSETDASTSMKFNIFLFACAVFFCFLQV